MYENVRISVRTGEWEVSLTMKYKIGDEVLVKARINSVSNIGTGLPYEVKEIDNKEDRPRTIWVSEQDIQEVPDMTAEEAWEIVRKIIYEVSDGGMTLDELRSVYGTSDYQEILSHYSPQQAKDKIEAWEAEKEIKVGDVVTITNNDPTSITNEKTVHTGVITSTHPDNYYDIILGDGLAWSYVDGEKIKKTGRHIDIDGFLKEIGETDA